MLKRLVLSSLMKMFLEEDCWSLFLKRGWMRDQRDTLTGKYNHLEIWKAEFDWLHFMGI